MSNSDFEQLGTEDRILYGPRKLLVCGYPARNHDLILLILQKIELNDVPVIFLTREQENISLSDLLQRDDRSGYGKDSDLGRAIIMSGFKESEVHTMMTVYKYAKGPAQLWATLTPVSESWNLGQLLEELQEERDALNADVD